MRGRSWGVLLVLVVGATVVRSEDSDQDQIVRQALEDRYATYVRAWKERDYDVLPPLFTEDFSVWRRDGKVQGRPDVLAEMKAFLKDLKAVKTYTIRIDNLVVEGDQAQATITETFALEVRDDDGEVHELAGESKSKDTWVKAEEGWKVKRSEELNSKMTLDGQPFDPEPEPAPGLPQV